MVLFVIVLALLLAFIVAMWCVGGLRETVGDVVVKMFPKEPLSKGDKVEIYLNGEYNRSATIHGATIDKVLIYDGRLGLPLNYRGRFYAVGIDTEDGSRLAYVKCRKHFRFIRLAEIMRKAFNVMDDEQMMPITEDGAGYDKEEETEETEDTEDEM